MLRWLAADAPHDIDDDGITIHAGAATDWFVDPRTGTATATAPVAVVVEGTTPVTVACTADVSAAATFDAACLFAHVDDTHWVKLAVELDPTGRLRVVTVVTDGRSDDCNHLLVHGTRCALRITVDDTSVALHVRPEGEPGWELVRYCRTPFASAPAIGLEAQSPTGSGVSARFTDVVVEHRAVEELRDGS